MSLSRRLKKGEVVDVLSTMYYRPSRVRIRYNDKVKFANLSSCGIAPKRITPGFTDLIWGKTYRDEIITQFRGDIMSGLITKGEILDSLPDKLRGWMWKKLKDIPYDIDYYERVVSIDENGEEMVSYVPTENGVTPHLIRMYRQDHAN
jgi:hypothetical protein